MIDICQWRAVVGTFCQPRSAKVSASDSVQRSLRGMFTLILLSSLSILFINNVAVSTFCFSTLAAVHNYFQPILHLLQPLMFTGCVKQPFVDLLLQQGIESNPGPGIEEVLKELHSFREEMMSQLNALRNESETNFCALRGDIEGIKTEMISIRVELEEVKSKVEMHSVEWEATGETIDRFADKLERVEEEVERLERYSRRENIMLYGMKEEYSP